MLNARSTRWFADWIGPAKMTSPSVSKAAKNQDVVTCFAPKTIQTTIGTLKTFCVLLPEACQSRIYRDVTHATPVDIDVWLDAAHRHGFAPSTLNNILNALHR